MSDKTRKQKDGENKDKKNERQHAAESNPEEKSHASAVTEQTEKGYSAGANAPGASGSNNAPNPDAN
jgi:hypothetical protein